MAAPASGTSRLIALAVAAVLIVFAILNFLDLGRQPYNGLSTSDNVVVRIDPGSPAEQAGFQTGDRIVTNGGIDVTDAKALARRPRPAPGDTREFTVARDGANQTLTLTYTAMPSRNWALGVCGLLIGLAFVVFGMRPYLRSAGGPEKLFVAASLCLGFAFIGWPYTGSYAIRTALAAVLVPVIYIGLALLVHFLSTFPKRVPWLDRAGMRTLLYAPAVAFAAFVLFTIVVQPRATSGLNAFGRIFSGVVVAGYFVSAILVLVRQYGRASAQQRQQLGLNIMVGAVVVALLPVILAIVTNVLAPKAVLPGSDFYFLTFILLPIGLSVAVVRAQALEDTTLPSHQPVG